MTKGVRFSDVEKAAIVKEVKGKDFEEVATRHGIAVSTVKDWLKVYKKPRRAKRARRKVSKAVAVNGSNGAGEKELTQEIMKLSVEAMYWKNEFLKLYKEKNP
jgi:transposase-like protein